MARRQLIEPLLSGLGPGDQVQRIRALAERADPLTRGACLPRYDLKMGGASRPSQAAERPLPVRTIPPASTCMDRAKRDQAAGRTTCEPCFVRGRENPLSVRAVCPAA